MNFKGKNDICRNVLRTIEQNVELIFTTTWRVQNPLTSHFCRNFLSQCLLNRNANILTINGFITSPTCNLLSDCFKTMEVYYAKPENFELHCKRKVFTHLKTLEI